LEAALGLKIKHYRTDGTVVEFWSDVALEATKDIVCQWVRDGLADRIEIRNAQGELVFHYPLETPSPDRSDFPSKQTLR
jgi:hypothetical protein